MLAPRVSKSIDSQLTLLSEMAIVLFAVTVPALLFRTRPACAMVALFAAFYALTYNMAVQYIVWILPFLCLAFPIWSVVYTLASLFGIATFYRLYYPGAVPSAAPWHALLALFGIARRHGAAVVIGASTLLVLYVLFYGLATASSLFASLSSRLPSWITRRLTSIQDANIDAVAVCVTARANAEDSAV